MTGDDSSDDSSRGDDDDASLVHDWVTVVRAVDAVQHLFAIRLEGRGVSLPYFAVLTLLLEAEDQRLPMSRIARDLAMTSGGFTKLADRMARDGLIDRRGSAGDRRVVFAALTAEGRDQAQRAVAAYRTFLRDEVLQMISRDELAVLFDLAQRLGEVRLDPDAEPPSFEISPRTSDEPDRRGQRDSDPLP